MKTTKTYYNKLSKRTFYILLILTGLLNGNILAQQNLDDYLTMAAQNNPSLKAAFNRYMAALEKIPSLHFLVCHKRHLKGWSTWTAYVFF